MFISNLIENKFIYKIIMYWNNVSVLLLRLGSVIIETL